MVTIEIRFIKTNGTWREVANAARTTVNMNPGIGEPSSSWKRRILMAEHSPIRKLKVNWLWEKIKYWVSVHFVRHKVGIEHFVSTQRSDRTGVNRDEKSQGALVNHEVEANAHAIINISRKRRCRQASKETRDAWNAFLKKLELYEPELVSVCVPECVYRNGFCPEMKSCGWNKTKEFEEELKKYLQGFEKQINKNTSIFKKMGLNK